MCILRSYLSLNLESHWKHSVLSLECAYFVKNSRIGHIEDGIYKNIPITFAAGSIGG